MKSIIVRCGVKEGAHFLGLDITNCMSQREVENILEANIRKLLDHISKLNFELVAKLFFYETGVLAKFRWWFAIYENVSLSTVTALQQMAYQAFRSWGRMGRAMTGEAFTSRRGFGIQDLRETYRASRSIAVLNGMKAKDPITVEAYRSKATMPAPYSKDKALMKLITGVDTPLETDTADYTTKGGLKKEAQQFGERIEVRENIKGFGWSCKVPDFDEKDASLIKGVLRGLPKDSEVSWALRALCDKLNTKAELGRKLRWTRDQTLCPQCSAQGESHCQTLKHVLNTCPVSLRNGRFLSRHNAVLREINSRLGMANKEKDNQPTLRGRTKTRIFRKDSL